MQEEVLEMDDIIDLDEELVPPPPATAPVEVHIPHVQNPQNFLVDEVPLEDLIPFDDLVPQPNEQAPYHSR